MRCVYKTPDRTVAHLLRGALEAEDIPAVVEGEHLSALHGVVPAGSSAELRVSILNEHQLDLAERVIAAWRVQREAQLESGPWRCEQCGEEHEPQFSECWKCGTGRGAA